MLWGQRIMVYTDHKNLIQEALGLTSDQVYRQRLLLEEYGPNIVHIKGIHNIVANAISCLDYGPVSNDKDNWMTFTKCWCHNTIHSTYALITSNIQTSMNLVFANSKEEEVIYPFMVKEIAQAQQDDPNLQALAAKDKYTMKLIENTKVLCKDDKLVIPAALHHRAVSWYHHYLQHPGNTRLEETLRAAMYWTNMRTTVRSYVKNCRSCQINKRQSKQYGKLPTKFVITTPWEALCVDLIGPY